MAHHSATKKSIKQVANRKERNTAVESRIRTAVKNVRTAVSNGEKEASTSALKTAQIELDKGVTRGVVKKNTASRTISRLNKEVKALVAGK